MATILLVDDDRELLEDQGAPFRSSGHFDLLTARDGAEALPLLESRSIDLLIIDLQMPLMDGFELLTYALPLQPDAHIVLLSEVATELPDLTTEASDTVELLLKPLEPGALLECARAALARTTRGHFSGLSLSGFLQLLALERSSVAITVRQDGRRGTIEMLDGELVSAATGMFKGREGLLELLSWRDPELEIVGSASKRPREIDDSLEALLMEAAQIRDEALHASSDSLARQWIERPAGTERLPSLDLTPKQLETVHRLLLRVMLLDGARGVALLDSRSGAPLASEGHRLKADLEQSAEHLATLARSRQHLVRGAESVNQVERLTIHLQHHVEILYPFPRQPWALYFLGRKSLIDEQAVRSALERIAGKIKDTLAPKDPGDNEGDANDERLLVDQDDTISPFSARHR